MSTTPCLCAAMAEEGFMVMTNWETGAQIGWWVQVGRHELGDGLVSDWYPEYETQERREDGSVGPSSAVVPHHKHPDSYFFLRLPCPDPNKVLFHRQLWRDLNGRRLTPEEMVHHRNHQKGDNVSSNLVMMTKAAHLALHAREKRQQPAFGKRCRGPRRNQVRRR